MGFWIGLFVAAGLVALGLVVYLVGREVAKIEHFLRQNERDE